MVQLKKVQRNNTLPIESPSDEALEDKFEVVFKRLRKIDIMLDSVLEKIKKESPK